MMTNKCMWPGCSTPNLAVPEYCTDDGILRLNRKANNLYILFMIFLELKVNTPPMWFSLQLWGSFINLDKQLHPMLTQANCHKSRLGWGSCKRLTFRLLKTPLGCHLCQAYHLSGEDLVLFVSDWAVEHSREEVFLALKFLHYCIGFLLSFLFLSIMPQQIWKMVNTLALYSLLQTDLTSNWLLLDMLICRKRSAGGIALVRAVWYGL